jgi:hypothetical protein
VLEDGVLSVMLENASLINLVQSGEFKGLAFVVRIGVNNTVEFSKVSSTEKKTEWSDGEAAFAEKFVESIVSRIKGR